MKLFIDTSNKKIILAIVNDKNRIIDFLIKDTNNDMVENALSIIREFVKKNKLDLLFFDEYMITTGPGSFTGVKVSLNILRSINLVKKIEKVHTIGTFKLLEQKGKKYIAIPFGKNKYYLKNGGKIKVVDNLDEIAKSNIIFGYDSFTVKTLKEKINSDSFKVLDNIDKVKLKYLTVF